MSEQPGRASWTDRPSAPGEQVDAIAAGQANGQVAGLANGQVAGSATGDADRPADGERARSAAAEPDGTDRPGRTSDLGRFDWFAEAGQFGLSGSAPAPPVPATARAKKRRPRPSWRAAAVCGLVLACTALGGVVGGFVAVQTIDNKAQDGSYSLGAVPSAPSSRPANSVAGIASRDTPSVVMIKVDGSAGTGSGFVVAGGYIVTDNHVVTMDGLAPHASLEVYFSNGKSARAQLVGRDPFSDIAVVRAVGVADLPALSLGNSARVAVGDTVIAIGSPLGLADTVTSGIVSAVGRPVQPASAGSSVPAVFFDAIQTDAPINPGNSGGPLVNTRGQVIGMDAAIDTLGSDPITGAQGGSIGLGFAIPVNEVRRIAVELIRTGHATHSVIGAGLSTVDNGLGAQITASSGHNDTSSITPGGPAAKAGLRPGDVITRFGSQPVTDSNSLLDAVRSLAPGTRVTVTFRRGGQTLTTHLTLGSAGT
jgi:S1-C subfamily serine protease